MGLDVPHNAPNRAVLVVLPDVKEVALWLAQVIVLGIVILLVREDVKANAGQHVEVLATKNALVAGGVANILQMEHAADAQPTAPACVVQHVNMFVIMSH